MDKRLSVPEISARKGGTPIVVLTAYTAPVARMLDPHVDVLLVGDSLGMVVYGMESTLPVTLDMMVRHGQAVVNSSKKALVVVDMPFGSYQASPADAYYAAAEILAQTGCHAVKLEGGIEMAETIRLLVQGGIPVMGHVALMPQHVNSMGGYRYQGRTEKDAARILKDAQAVEKAGAFAVVLEGLQENVARDITKKLSIPTIGIGASPSCDGQVLVIDDMLGLSERAPSFVKEYADVAGVIDKAAKAYADDVRKRRFPAEAHVFKAKAKK